MKVDFRRWEGKGTKWELLMFNHIIHIPMKNRRALLNGLGTKIRYWRWSCALTIKDMWGPLATWHWLPIMPTSAFSWIHMLYHPRWWSQLLGALDMLCHHHHLSTMVADHSFCLCSPWVPWTWPWTFSSKWYNTLPNAISCTHGNCRVC